MFINVDNIEFQPWSFRRISDRSLPDIFGLTRKESEIIERVVVLASDKNNVQQGIFKLLEETGALLRLRIFNWLEYLLERAFLRSGLFNQMLDTVIWAVREKLFLHRQTQYQFDSCKYYLDIIFKADVNIVNLQRCREAFLCICMLAERPDLQLRSFTCGLNLLEDVFKPKGVQFFDHLFNDHSQPLFFKEHFVDCSMEQLQLLMGLLEGRSPRKLLAPEILISKRENALLHHLPLDLTSFHTGIVERYVLAVKLLKEAPEAGLMLQSLLETSHKFEEDLESFAMDLKFWKEAFRFLVKAEKHLGSYRDVRSIVDYFEYQRYGQEDLGNYSLKGRTYESVIRAVEEWHQGETFHFTKKDLQATWRPLKIPQYHRTLSTVVYRITEITSGERLLKESRVMEHCVFSYLPMCKAGSTHIFSLSEEKDSVRTMKLTIEVKAGKVVQAYGKNNSEPSEELVAVLSDWCRRNNIVYP